MVKYQGGLVLSNLGPLEARNTTYRLAARTYNALNNDYTCVYQAMDAMNVNQVGFNFESRVGSPGDLTFQIGNLTTLGLFGSTVYAFATTASSTLTYSTSGSINWITLNTSRTFSRGEYFAIRMRTSAGTWNSTNYITILAQIDNGEDFEPSFMHGQLPYMIRGNNATRDDGVNGGVRNSTTGKVWGNIVKNINYISMDSSTTVYGIKFSLPYPWRECILQGLVYHNFGTEPVADAEFRAYSISGTTITLLTTATKDKDFGYYSGLYTANFYFPSPITLYSGTSYFIGMLGTSVSPNSIRTYEFTDSAEMSPFTRGSFPNEAADINVVSSSISVKTNELRFIAPIITNPTKTSY